MIVRTQVIVNEQLQTVQQLDENVLPLDSYQLAVAQHIDQAVHSRQQFYTNHTSLNSHQYMSDSDSGSESDDYHNADDDMAHLGQQSEPNLVNADRPHCTDTAIQWEKPILIIGKAGAGKTETICQSV